MASALTPTGRNFPAWPKYALRITFGVIWLIDAVLKWLPGFRSGYVGMISGAGQGQPGWLRPWFSFWTNLQSPHPTVFAYIVAILETLVLKGLAGAGDHEQLAAVEGGGGMMMLARRMGYVQLAEPVWCPQIETKLKPFDCPCPANL